MNLPPPEIFKAYDIRGIVGKSLTVEGVRLIGQALGSELLDRPEGKAGRKLPWDATGGCRGRSLPRR